MKKRSLRTQLILSFLTISILIIGSLSILTLSLMNNHFNQFVKEKQEDLLNQYTKSLDFIWLGNQEEWNEKELNELSKKALDDHLLFSIASPDNNIFWQLPPKKLAETKTSLKKHADTISKTKGATLNEEVLVTKELKDNSKTFGKVTFFFYGPFAYTEHDAMFISSMKKSLISVAFIALIVSLIFASWVSQKISLPLKHVSQFTHHMALGQYKKKLPQETVIEEINLLIDSLNDLSKQLDKQATLRKRLTSDISHELRTPLTTLKGNIEAMIDGVWEVTPNRLQSCYDEVDRLTRMISNIELINNIENKKEKLTFTKFDLSHSVQSVITNFSSKINEKQLTISFDGQPTTFLGDKDKINQVLTNLLSNAIKFTQKNGQVHFSLQQEKTHLILTIQDNGIGIEKEQLPFIFDRFYMTDASRNRALGGQGIGLSIVKGVVEAHNGTIIADSQLGLGTTFTIKLPTK